MRIARKVKNAFTAREVEKITGLKFAMLNYLTNNGYIQPSYREDHDFPPRAKRQPRGNTRYYSYRDLIIAKAIQRLLDAGVQLTRMKRALESLREDKHWLRHYGRTTIERKLSWLVTDGKNVYLEDQRGFLELIGSGQKSFAFVLELKQVRREVEAEMRIFCKEKLAYFSLENADPVFDPPRKSLSSLKRR